MPLISHSSAAKDSNLFGRDAVHFASPLKVKTAWSFKMLQTTHTTVLHPRGLQSSIQYLGLSVSRKSTWLVPFISRDNKKYTEHPEHMGAEQETQKNSHGIHIFLNYLINAINSNGTHLSNTFHWQFKPGDYLRTDRKT